MFFFLARTHTTLTQNVVVGVVVVVVFVVDVVLQRRLLREAPFVWFLSHVFTMRRADTHAEN